MSIINQNEIGVVFTNLAIINQQEQSHKKKNNLKTLVKSACSQASGLESLGYATETQGQSLPSPMASALSAEAYLKPPRTCGIFWRSANKHVGKHIVIMIANHHHHHHHYHHVFSHFALADSTHRSSDS